MRKLVNKIFFAPLHIAALATFRVFFGILMMVGTARFMMLGWIEDHYINPKFHFKYFGFEWVEPLSLTGMYIVHITMFAAALLVTLGLYYRMACILLFLTFTYTELIDLSYYLNHYYFVSLVCLLLVFVPANRFFSLDVLRKPSLLCTHVPAWCINIFKIQLAIVYICAGLAKINYDWLIDAMPLKLWLPAKDNIWLIGDLFRSEYTAYAFSWTGMLYDTTIVFWLMWNTTRPLAYITVIIFHILTGILFQIGVFPVVMIAATLIFFSDEWHLRLQKWLASTFHKAQLKALNVKEKIIYRPLVNYKLIAVVTGVYILFQVIFPWRYLLYPGNLFWTEQGYRFGWRVMLMEKAGTAAFYVKDGKTGREGEVYNPDFLNTTQEKQMAMQPDMILQYAHFLKQHFEKMGVHNPAVRAEVFVTLNGRASKLYIDSTVDLALLKDNWTNKSWIKNY
ncbi:MAG: HTTM domain-containing protein [Ferruginibacter sp.]